MFEHFITGRFIFYNPAYQFNEPKLKSGTLLGIRNKNLYPLSKNKSPTTIQLKDIALPDAPVYEKRAKDADTSFPVWVVEGIKNPENKKYVLIDGKHRIHLSTKDSIQAIVFSVKEVRTVLEVVPPESAN